jgi:hypothetical protein
MNRLWFNPYLIIGVICTLPLFSCTSVYDKHVQWQTVKPDTFPIITAIGYAPISLQKSNNKTQRMLMAINASKLAAYAELAEQVYGQRINSTTTMSDLLIKDQSLKSSVQGIIRGAKVVKSYPVGDTYATELRLDFKDVYQLYETNQRKAEIKKVKYY